MAKKRSWLGRHSLSLVAVAILALWTVLYSRAAHLGAFFGNAIADWTGLVVMVIATKYLYERGSKESKQPRGFLPKRWEEALRDHSLTVFLVITGALWIALYAHQDSEAKWGKVVGKHSVRVDADPCPSAHDQETVGSGARKRQHTRKSECSAAGVYQIPIDSTVEYGYIETSQYRCSRADGPTRGRRKETASRHFT